MVDGSAVSFTISVIENEGKSKADLAQLPHIEATVDGVLGSGCSLWGAEEEEPGEDLPPMGTLAAMRAREKFRSGTVDQRLEKSYQHAATGRSYVAYLKAVGRKVSWNPRCRFSTHFAPTGNSSPDRFLATKRTGGKARARRAAIDRGPKY